MTKYILAYKKEGIDKWYKFAILNNHAQIIVKLTDLYKNVPNIEKVQIQKVIK